MVCAVQRLGTFGPLRCGEMYALDRLLREARVLELIRHVAKETPGGATQADEGEFITTERTIKQHTSLLTDTAKDIMNKVNYSNCRFNYYHL